MSLLLPRCVFTVTGVSVVGRFPAAAFVLAVAVGPAIVGVLGVVGDSVIVGFPAFAASLLVLPSLLLLCHCCRWISCYCFPAYLYVTTDDSPLATIIFFLLSLYLILLPCSFLLLPFLLLLVSLLCLVFFPVLVSILLLASCCCWYPCCC